MEINLFESCTLSVGFWEWGERKINKCDQASMFFSSLSFMQTFIIGIFVFLLVFVFTELRRKRFDSNSGVQ